MTGMTLELNTHTIQWLDIALIYCSTYAPDAIPAEVMEDLQQVLTDLNKLCTSDNNYTLNVEVTA